MNQSSVISLIPLIAFLTLFILQALAPRRELAKSGWRRIQHNFFLFLANTVCMRLLVPLSLVGVANWVASENLGLLNLFEIPLSISVLVCVVLLDFAIYWQHVATHKFPILWRFHKVHHADTDMDVTTAIRFHPLELLLSLGYKVILVVMIGVPVLAVIVFELLLFVSPAFNHSNLRLPTWLDASLRLVIATPDVHRAHHSIIVAEQNTNYGFFIIWWDKLFDTYTANPKNAHESMPIGLENSTDQCDRVDQMLLAPFK